MATCCAPSLLQLPSSVLEHLLCVRPWARVRVKDRIHHPWPQKVHRWSRHVNRQWQCSVLNAWQDGGAHPPLSLEISMALSPSFMAWGVQDFYEFLEIYLVSWSSLPQESCIYTSHLCPSSINIQVKPSLFRRPKNVDFTVSMGFITSPTAQSDLDISIKSCAVSLLQASIQVLSPTTPFFSPPFFSLLLLSSPTHCLSSPLNCPLCSSFPSHQNAPIPFLCKTLIQSHLQREQSVRGSPQGSLHGGTEGNVR